MSSIKKTVSLHKRKKMKALTTTICLDQMQFYAYHGVTQQEKKVGNIFFVSLQLTTPINASFQSDEVADTISYADVYTCVEKEMQKTANLLEYLCQQISEILYHTFPTITAINIRVDKQTPPMGGQIERVGIQLSSIR